MDHHGAGHREERDVVEDPSQIAEVGVEDVGEDPSLAVAEGLCVGEDPSLVAGVDVVAEGPCCYCCC